MSDSPYDNWHRLAHGAIINCLLAPYYGVRWRIRIRGRHHVPAAGPYVIAANHYSYYDPTIISLAVRQPVAYVAKQELFREPKLGPTITFLGAIPIDRDKPGTSTIKQAKRAFGAGWPVGVFIEGTRNQTRDRLTRLTPGAAFMAKVGGGVPVLPLGIIPEVPLRASIGEPIPYDPDLDALTETCGRRIAELAELEYAVQT